MAEKRMNGYSCANLLMDILMVLSIVVFLNVSIGKVTETALSKRITTLTSPISRVYEKLFSTSPHLDKMTFVSNPSGNKTRITIGTPLKEETLFDPASVPLFIRRAVFMAAKAKSLLPSTTTVETINVPELLRTSATIRKYYEGSEEAYVSPRGFIHNDAYPYDISLVTVLPITNLDSILALSESWSGPISACVFADAYETSSSQIQSFLREHDFQQRVTVTVVYSPLYGVLFPANLLRNIAISTVFTTHFIVIDASMRPSPLLYDKLRSIPIVALYEPINLVTVPVFFSAESAVRDIKQCVSDHKCLPKEPFMTREWFSPANGAYFMRAMKCLEPGMTYYFLRRHNSFDILYDETFLTAGYDQLQLIKQLQRDGYVFHLLLEEYFIDTSTALKLESDVMQKDREIRSQYMDFTAKLRTDRTVHSMDCTGERNPNPLLASYVEFLKKDSEKRRVEEEELQGVLDGMKGQFDLAGWLRQVRRVATERDQRLANM